MQLFYYELYMENQNKDTTDKNEIDRCKIAEANAVNILWNHCVPYHPDTFTPLHFYTISHLKRPSN
jgi:hypothetical protein